MKSWVSSTYGSSSDKHPIIITVCMVAHTDSKGKDQPSKVFNPARGQLNRENEYLLVRVRT